MGCEIRKDPATGRTVSALTRHLATFLLLLLRELGGVNNEQCLPPRQFFEVSEETGILTEKLLSGFPSHPWFLPGDGRCRLTRSRIESENGKKSRRSMVLLHRG